MKPAGKKLYYKIGEVCEMFGIEAHVLRYWETEFPLLSPVKNNAGQRIYRDRDLEIIQTIKGLLYEQGFTIAGARKKLTERSAERNLPLFTRSAQEAQKNAIVRLRKEIEQALRILDDRKD